MQIDHLWQILQLRGLAEPSPLLFLVSSTQINMPDLRSEERQTVIKQIPRTQARHQCFQRDFRGSRSCFVHQQGSASCAIPRAHRSWRIGRLACGLQEKDLCLRTLVTWSFPTAMLGEASSVASLNEVGGLWRKRRADLEAPSVGQAPRATVYVTQHIRRARCESLISLDAADRGRCRACSSLRAKIRPKRRVSHGLHGTSEMSNDASCTCALCC